MVLERLASCPACGTTVAADVRFCPTCGQRLAADPTGGTTGGPAIDPFLARVRAALIGDYEVSHEIGRGGMAAVFLAKDLRLPRRVALKVMLPELTYSTVMPQRFVGEARTAAMLDHPNIVPVFHAGEQDGLRYFAMRYIDGCSLERLQRARGPLPVTLACHLLAEIAAALDYAHAQGVVHRDVKPANVMIDRRFGRAIVTDFGIARVADGQRLTSTGLAIGTPEYMSPEQYASEDVTGASDQYALGALAFHLLAGRPPFIGTQAEVLMAHLREPPPPLRALRPDVPAVIETIVERMLAKAPTDRWPSLGELAARFTEHVGSAALAVPSQLIALLPDRQSDEPAPLLPQTPVSPAAGVRRPEEPSEEPSEQLREEPSEAAPPVPTSVGTVPSLQVTGYTPRGLDPAGAALARDAAPVADPMRATATISRYTPVAPAEVEPLPPEPGPRVQRYIVGGVLGALVAAVLYLNREEPPFEPPPVVRGDAGGSVAPPTPAPEPAAPPAPVGGEVEPVAPAAPPPSAPPPPPAAVDPTTVREVSIGPPRGNLAVAVGDSVRLTARLVDGSGNAIATIEPARWTSSVPGAARVSPDGWVRALAPARRVTLTARIGSARASRTLRVTPPQAVARVDEAPRPAAPATLTTEQATRLVERVVAAIDAQRVDEVRPLLEGPAAGRLLEVLQKERNVQATPHIMGPPEGTGSAAMVPVRVALSWQRYLLKRMAGRHEATVALLARVERDGDGWRIASLQVPSFVPK